MIQLYGYICKSLQSLTHKLVKLDAIQSIQSVVVVVVAAFFGNKASALGKVKVEPEYARAW